MMTTVESSSSSNSSNHTTKRIHADDNNDSRITSSNSNSVVNDDDEDFVESSSKKIKLDMDNLETPMTTKTTTMDCFDGIDHNQPFEVVTSISDTNNNNNNKNGNDDMQININETNRNADEICDYKNNEIVSEQQHDVVLPATAPVGVPKKKRWRAHVWMEYYTEAVGHLMMPPDKTVASISGCAGAGGAAAGGGVGNVNPYSDGLERITTLGYLTSPLRQRTVWEDWSPREVALFEAALMQYGKDFSRIAHKHLMNKETKDVVAFYYIWKKTQHYKEWKRQYQPDDDIGSACIVDMNDLSSSGANGGKPR